MDTNIKTTSNENADQSSANSDNKFNNFEDNLKEPRQAKKKKSGKDKGDESGSNISYSQEILRKVIHLTSLSIPVGYFFVSQLTALSVLVPATLIFVILDILSKKDNVIGRLAWKIFGKMLRKHEKQKKKLILNGASWVLISACITIFLFPKIIALTAFVILIISDSSAALFGRKYGKTPLFNKSWEGTSAFFVSAFLVVFVLARIFHAPDSYYIAGFISAVIGGLVEAYSKQLKMDDNLSIPLSVGISMWGIGNNLANVMDSFINLLK